MRAKKVVETYACQNMPGQDVKNGHRLIKRPDRYKKLVGKLNRAGVGVVAMQESTGDLRNLIRHMEKWQCYGAMPNNRAGQVGNGIAWRTDLYTELASRDLRLTWHSAYAEHGFLSLPMVTLKHKVSGEKTTFVSTHLPTPWVARESDRQQMVRAIRAQLKPLDRWVIMGDWNDGHSSLSVGGKRIASAHVDAIVVSKGFKSRRTKVVSRGVMWKISDHPMVIVKGRWK